MKTKQEIIEEAYGPDFEALKHHIDMESGVCTHSNARSHIYTGRVLVGEIGYWIPLKLGTTLKNNGWLPIKQFSPKVGEYYEFVDTNGRRFLTKIHTLGSIENLTRTLMLFKKVKLSEPPIFIK